MNRQFLTSRPVLWTPMNWSNSCPVLRRQGTLRTHQKLKTQSKQSVKNGSMKLRSMPPLEGYSQLDFYGRESIQSLRVRKVTSSRTFGAIIAVMIHSSLLVLIYGTLTFLILFGAVFAVGSIILAALFRDTGTGGKT